MIALAYATGSVLLAGPVFAQTAPAGGSGGYSETQYARELLHLKQVDVMQAELAKAKGTAAENLWLAQLDQAGYDAAVKDPANAGKATADYLAALAGYLQSQRDVTAIDGAWALDHAQFILSHISQPILTRMEYFSNNARDRAALVPLAAAADRLLKVASGSLEAAKARIETGKPFDEKAYNRAYAASTEARYYAAWALYFQAMALDPGAADITARNKLLRQAAEGLADWAIDTPDNGVNFQSYLLRGKAESEAGESAKALADFAKALSDKAPAWVQYQARYQSVVVHLRAGDFLNAQTALADFKKAIPAGNSEALLSADMLGYRVDWAVALTRQDASERKRAQREALGILTQIVARDGRFRDLVYEQLAAEIPENADLNDLFPMQQLALARVTSLNQKGDTAESRRQLGVALNAAAAVRINPLANNPDKVEAIFLQGVCNALLGNAGAAAKFEVEFATAVPQDSRARQVIDLALQQIGQLRQAGAGSAPAATQAAGGGMSAEELRALAGQALNLSINTFGDKKWLFAQGRLLEEAGRSAEAAGVYQKIALEDRSYLDARYRLVALATERIGSVEGKGSEREQKAAAGELFGAAAGFMDLLDHPPASAPPETLQAAQGYRYTIWLIEAATAVSPAVADTQVALDRLARLDAAQEKLSQAQRDLVLRYRMQAYQLAGQIDKAQAALAQYGKSSPAALENIRNLALTTEEQISRTHDAGQIKQMAGFVVMLLEPMIAGAKAEGKADIAYAYRLEQADMMAQAGQFAESQALAVSLEAEREGDIRPNMIEARAMFSQAQAGNDTGLYAKAQDYFTRILARVPTGSEAFWESWLRVIQSMEAQAVDPAAEIKARLGDLKAIYGAQFGGTRYHDEFAKLAGKYGVTGN